MSERLTKRQLKHDVFLESVQSVLAYAREHALVVVASLIVFVAAVALAFRVGGSATGSRPQDPEAEQALSAARTQFAMGQLDAGREGLERVRSEHGRSRAAREATYILANAYYEAKDWTKASETFEAFLKKPLHDDLLKDGARLGLAACKEQSGDVAGALEAYRALWTTAALRGSRIQAAMAAARCARTLGRLAEARALYQGIVDAFPVGPAADQARFALAGLPAA